MVYKLLNATDAKQGAIILIDNEACMVKTNDKSKSGKHGAAKCRIEALSIIDGKKKVIAVPGHERFDVPMIDKRKAQVLSMNGEMASVMDLESFETIDVPMIEELRSEVNPEDQVEYWIIDEAIKIIKRKL